MLATGTEIHQETSWPTTSTDDFWAWVSTLSREEYEAVTYYVEHGHKDINATLRRNETSDLIKALDSALMKGEKMAGTFYRGCDFFSDDIRIGDEFSSRTFYSTSVSPFEAMKFAGDSTPVLFRIRSDRGGHVISSHRDEYEVLFERGAKFQITDIQRNVEVKMFYPGTDYSITHSHVTVVDMIEQH